MLNALRTNVLVLALLVVVFTIWLSSFLSDDTQVIQIATIVATAIATVMGKLVDPPPADPPPPPPPSVPQETVDRILQLAETMARNQRPQRE